MYIKRPCLQKRNAFLLQVSLLFRGGVGMSPEIGRVQGVYVRLPVSYVTALDRLVGQKMYANRCEAIRMAVRDLLLDEAWRKKK